MSQIITDLFLLAFILLAEIADAYYIHIKDICVFGMKAF